MASPRQLSIIPGCLLNIEVKEPDSTMIDHTHSSSAWKYQITNIDEIFTATHVNAAMQESVEGWLSPTHRITLPPKIKMKAGIPLEARSYAFMYPPEGLAELSQSELELYDSDDIFLHTLMINLSVSASTLYQRIHRSKNFLFQDHSMCLQRQTLIMNCTR